MGFTGISEKNGEENCENWSENEFCILPRQLLHEVNNSDSSFPWRATWSEALGAVLTLGLADDHHLGISYVAQGD